jgi:fatty-acyl-CoA synthase
MQDVPLTVAGMIRHGLALYGDSEVVTLVAPGKRRHQAYSEIAERAAQLAHALRALGIGTSDRVGTFLWNDSTHQEAYLAIPGMGAVLHTVNIRLSPEQVGFVVTHAADTVVIVDGGLLPSFLEAADGMPTLKHVVLVGPTSTQGRDAASARFQVHDYEDLLAAHPPRYPWRDDIDERAAAAVCYTSGTTGDPKGVVYSHRSTYLHSVGVNVGNVYGMTERDRVVPVVPMFHANAWGLPYASWLAGADLLMPSRFLQAEALCDFMAVERATIAAGVPTIWSDVLRHLERRATDLSSLRMLVGGGSAVPLSMMQAFASHGLRLVQGWGMTETSPVAAIAEVPKGAEPDDEWAWRSRTGRLIAGVECRIVDDDGATLPTDGVAVGEFECRGPWVTGSYHGVESPATFHDGWLRTGDVGTLDSRGYMQITDRAKDLVKSGGEWISSVELENALMAHASVREAAVIAIPDAKWQERPLAVVVAEPGEAPNPAELAAFLSSTFATWQVPESWAFTSALPRTSVGKFDKKALRRQFVDNGLDVRVIDTRGVLALPTAGDPS